MLRSEAIAILDTAREPYVPADEIRQRTEQALAGDAAQLHYDGINVQRFLDEEFLWLRTELQDRCRYSLLDVGCGYGRFVPWLAGFDCERYVGIDPDELRIQFCARWAGGVRQFSRDTAITYWKQHPDQRFDVLYCRTVLQHLFWHDKVATLLCMAELTRPGGTILLFDDAVFDESLDWCAERYRDPACAVHMIPMPLFEIRKLLSGFAGSKLTPNLVKFVKHL